MFRFVKRKLVPGLLCEQWLYSSVVRRRKWGFERNGKIVVLQKGQTLSRPMGGQGTAPEEESLLLSHLPLERQDDTDG